MGGPVSSWSLRLLLLSSTAVVAAAVVLCPGASLRVLLRLCFPLSRCCCWCRRWRRRVFVANLWPRKMAATATLECPFVVQDPKEVTLCYDVLSWEDTIHKFGVKILQVKVAYILTDRAQEFVRGECENVVAPTRFYRTHTKSCYPGSLKRPTKRSFLHQIW